MQAYDDAMTYRLVAAASKVLALPQDDVMRTFGVYWVVETAETGYGPLLALWGSTFVEFVSNLDSLHARVAETFTKLKPPSFEVEQKEPGVILVHYRSERSGLQPFVAGLLEGVGQRFDTRVVIEWARAEHTNNGHDLFRVEYSSSVS